MNNQQIATAIVDRLLHSLSSSSLPDCIPGALEHIKGYREDMIKDILEILKVAS
jgi:hypothetical protein